MSKYPDFEPGDTVRYMENGKYMQGVIQETVISMDAISYKIEPLGEDGCIHPQNGSAVVRLEFELADQPIPPPITREVAHHIAFQHVWKSVATGEVRDSVIVDAVFDAIKACGISDE